MSKNNTLVYVLIGGVAAYFLLPEKVKDMLPTGGVTVTTGGVPSENPTDWTNITDIITRGFSELPFPEFPDMPKLPDWLMTLDPSDVTLPFTGFSNLPSFLPKGIEDRILDLVNKVNPLPNLLPDPNKEVPTKNDLTFIEKLWGLGGKDPVDVWVDYITGWQKDVNWEAPLGYTDIFGGINIFNPPEVLDLFFGTKKARAAGVDMPPTISYQNEVVDLTNPALRKVASEKEDRKPSLSELKTKFAWTDKRIKNPDPNISRVGM